MEGENKLMRSGWGLFKFVTGAAVGTGLVQNILKSESVEPTEQLVNMSIGLFAALAAINGSQELFTGARHSWIFGRRLAKA